MSTSSLAPEPGASSVVAPAVHDVRYWVEEHKLHDVVGQLWRHGLIKYQAGGGLPLKGLDTTTDIYFNIRLARNNPKALKYLQGLFGNAINYMLPQFDLMLDIPHGISPVIAALMLTVDKPMVTIRDVAKHGRVENAEYIGRFEKGQHAVPIDDVITTAGSKLDVLEFAKQHELVVPFIMVLVDRDDGPWRTELANRGITVPIMAGFSLSKVRPLIQELAQSDASMYSH